MNTRKDIIQSMLDSAKGPHMAKADRVSVAMRHFNLCVSLADNITGHACDHASIHKLIWMLVQLGHIDTATELRLAAEAIGYLEGRKA